MGNPFLTYAGLTERSTRLIHHYIFNEPEVVGYQVWGASTVNDAYGNPAGSGVGGTGCTAFFEVSRSDFYRSQTLRKKGLAAIPMSRKGTTQWAFDPEDFTAPGLGLPASLEDLWVVLRVQENRLNSGLLNFAGNPLDPVLGPLYLVPPAQAASSPRTAFTLSGTAPSATGCTAGAPPVYNQNLLVATPRPMVLVFPSFLESFTLRNLGAGNDILVSLGETQTMMTLKQGAELQIYNGGVKSVVLSCPNAGGCPFTIHGAL